MVAVSIGSRRFSRTFSLDCEVLMPKPRNQSRILADLVEAYHGRPVERVDGHDLSSPRLRLQDCQVVEEMSMESTDYVLLRRIKIQKNGIASLTPRERDAVRHTCTGASTRKSPASRAEPPRS